MARRGSRLQWAAREIVEQIVANADTVVVPQTDAQFRSALFLYTERRDRGWGLTDCASCLVMRALGITDAPTYYRHFEQMGFSALLRT